MQASEMHRLERSADDRVIAGVCGGIAEHFAIDATIVRVVAVVLTLFGGAGLLLYAVAWAMIPEQGHRRSYADAWLRHPGWQPWVGIVLILIAFSIVSDHVWHLGDIGFPIFLIGVGAFLLFVRPTERPVSSPPPGSDAAVPTTTTPPPAAPGAAPAPDAPAGGADVTAPVASVAPVATTDATTPWPTTATPPTALGPSWRQVRRQQRRDWREETRRVRARRHRGPSITRPTLGVLALGAGATGIVLAAGGTVNPVVVLAIGMIIIGAGLVVAARFGHAGGLVPVGLLTLAVLSIVAAVHIPFDGGGIGQAHETPFALSDIPADGYHQAIGELRIDLSKLNTASAAGPIHVTATVGIGHLLVLVPRDSTVVVRGHTEIGNVHVINDDASFWKVDHTVTVNGAGEHVARFEVDATIGIGEVEVQDAA